MNVDREVGRSGKRVDAVQVDALQPQQGVHQEEAERGGVVPVAGGFDNAAVHAVLLENGFAHVFGGQVDPPGGFRMLAFQGQADQPQTAAHHQAEVVGRIALAVLRFHALAGTGEGPGQISSAFLGHGRFDGLALFRRQHAVEPVVTCGHALTDLAALDGAVRAAVLAPFAVAGLHEHGPPAQIRIARIVGEQVGQTELLDDIRIAPHIAQVRLPAGQVFCGAFDFHIRKPGLRLERAQQLVAHLEQEIDHPCGISGRHLFL